MSIVGWMEHISGDETWGDSAAAELAKDDRYLSANTTVVAVCRLEALTKNLVMLSGFWLLRGWGSLSQSASKKKKICEENPFSQMLNEVLKLIGG